MKKGKMWKDMTRVQMIKDRKDVRKNGLPHYQPERSPITREKREAQQTKNLCWHKRSTYS